MKKTKTSSMLKTKKTVKETKAKKTAKKIVKKTSGRSKKLTQEEMFPLIQKRAFHLWRQAGKPFGNDWEFWFKAEKEIKAKYAKK